jgi:hypothetical protein
MDPKNVSKLNRLLDYATFWDRLDKILQEHKLGEFSGVWEQKKDSPSKEFLASLDETNEMKLAKLMGDLTNGKIPPDNLAPAIKKELKTDLKTAEKIVEEIDEAISLSGEPGTEKELQVTQEPKASKEKSRKRISRRETPEGSPREDIYRELPE